MQVLISNQNISKKNPPSIDSKPKCY